MRKRIIYIVHFPRDRVHDDVIAGVRRYAAVRGWEVGVYTWKEAQSGSFMRDAWSAPRPIGTIVEGSVLPADLPTGVYGGSPAVFINCTPPRPRGLWFVRIDLDDSAVAAAAFRELSMGKCAAYAVVGFCQGPRRWSDVRVRAFRRAAAGAGARCHVFSFADPRYGDATGEDDRLAAWLSTLPRHTAIFAVNDDTAARVAAAARAAFLDIPRDLTLIGVDNDPSVCETSHPTLTSIQMDFENAGFQAAKMLEEIVAARGNRGRRPENILFGPLLAVHRESTMGAGRREPHILEAVEMIRREACSGLTVAELASRFRGSRRLFEMRFREAMGHSVLDEIQHVRMQRVHALLSSDDVAVGAVADFCGFGSDRALRKVFLAREGISMTEWRNRHRR